MTALASGPGIQSPRKPQLRSAGGLHVLALLKAANGASGCCALWTRPLPLPPTAPQRPGAAACRHRHATTGALRDDGREQHQDSWARALQKILISSFTAGVPTRAVLAYQPDICDSMSESDAAINQNHDFGVGHASSHTDCGTPGKGLHLGTSDSG